MELHAESVGVFLLMDFDLNTRIIYSYCECFWDIWCVLNSVYVCVCARAQGVFDHRMKTWQKWQDSQLLLQRKREAEAKLQFTNKPDKLQQAKDEIREVRHKNGWMNVNQHSSVEVVSKCANNHFVDRKMNKNLNSVCVIKLSEQ